MAREGSFTHVRRELRPRVGISACMVTGGWSFTHVRRELWPRVILGYRLMGISACMAREGSFTHVRRVLRPRVGISACMVTGGWSFTHVRRELWPRVILGYRLMGISACMAREGSFTHVRRMLRPRAGISACMVTGGWSFTHVRREHWPRVILGLVYLGYLHAWPGKGVLLMLGASSDQGREYLHAWSWEGGVLLMLGASSGQGLFWGID